MDIALSRSDQPRRRNPSLLMASGWLLALAAAAQASDGDSALGSFQRPDPPRARKLPQHLPPPFSTDDSLALAARRTAPACVWTEAARQGRDAELRAAARRPADLDCMAADGFTPLAAAAFAGRRSTVRLLLQAGVSLHRQTASGQTALHLAALAGQVDVIDELLRGRADVEMLNAQRESALDVAAQAGQGAAMGRLLQAGADSTRAGQR
jgi:ankyrin repeat protein